MKLTVVFVVVALLGAVALSSAKEPVLMDVRSMLAGVLPPIYARASSLARARDDDHNHVNPGCLEDKKIVQCEACDIVGSWKNTFEHTEYNNATNAVEYVLTSNSYLTFNPDNVMEIKVDADVQVSDEMINQIKAYMDLACPKQPQPKDNVILKVVLDAKVAYSSPVECLLDLGEQTSCNSECTSDFPVYFVDPCQPVSANATLAACSFEIPAASKLSMSNECKNMTVHDMSSTDDDSDMVFERVPGGGGGSDFFFIGVAIVILVVLGVVGFFLWKKFGARKEEHHGDDGLYEMGRDFDDDF